ncbi:unnamed protein product [Rotaria sordida]|uniref:Golgi apparatus protein 1 n=1 Tax=Rotaria sordida TaxID=392033 RepID=A0A819ZMT7_9BILA|nr:unnamed protein product [Rotaria sordida]
MISYSDSNRLNELAHQHSCFGSDGRFNQGLIDNCQRDINKYCQSEVVNKNDDYDSNEDDPDSNDNDNRKKTNDDDDRVTDRKMDGGIIQCLRSNYTNTSITLESQCVLELIDVIQTSKLDIKLDVKLYQNCRKFLKIECIGIDQEDCLKLLYQKNKIDDDTCKEQIKRIIREGQVDIYADRALTFACQADLLKYCNDIPIGSGKQLQCLLSMGKSVTSQCQTILQKRQELWEFISNVTNVVDLTEQIRKSNNSLYQFIVILLILCTVFMAGCMYGRSVRYNPIMNYDDPITIDHK